MGCRLMRNEFDSRLNGLYKSIDNDIVCIDNDSIFYKIDGKGAFDAYHVGIGKYESVKSNLFLAGKSFLEETSSVVKDKSSLGKMEIHIQYYDGSPIAFAKMEVKNINGDFLCNVSADKEGVFVFEDSIVNYNRVQINITDGILFETQQNIPIEIGSSFTIKSKIQYGIILDSNPIKLRTKNKSGIILQVTIEDRKRINFTKINEDCSCSESFDVNIMEVN